MALTVAGIRGPLEYCANFRAARIAAAISKTRLRPSSTQRSVALSLFVRQKRTARFAGRSTPSRQEASGLHLDSGLISQRGDKNSFVRHKNSALQVKKNQLGRVLTLRSVFSLLGEGVKVGIPGHRFLLAIARRLFDDDQRLLDQQIHLAATRCRRSCSSRRSGSTNRRQERS